MSEAVKPRRDLSSRVPPRPDLSFTRRVPQEQQVAVAEIDEDPENVRKVFDQAELESLAETMRRDGVIAPLTVSPVNAAGRYLLLVGARRLRAAKLAGIEKVPVLFRERGETPDDRRKQMIENVQRVNLSSEEWVLYIEGQRAAGRSLQDIADGLGQKLSTIKRYSAILKYAPEVRALAVHLGAEHLRELQTLFEQDPEAARSLIASVPPHELAVSTIKRAKSPTLDFPEAESDEAEWPKRPRLKSPTLDFSGTEGESPKDPWSLGIPLPVPGHMHDSEAEDEGGNEGPTEPPRPAAGGAAKGKDTGPNVPRAGDVPPSYGFVAVEFEGRSGLCEVRLPAKVKVTFSDGSEETVAAHDLKIVPPST